MGHSKEDLDSRMPPPVPSYCTLIFPNGHVPDMPIDARQMVGSPETGWSSQLVPQCRLRLMAWAWTNTPAGSIPGNLTVVPETLGISRADWDKYMLPVFRYEWVLCDDGRYYNLPMMNHVAFAWKAVCKKRLAVAKFDAENDQIAIYETCTDHAISSAKSGDEQ